MPYAPEIDSKFISFINEHHVLTIASSINDHPWSANCFYVYLKDEAAFVFTSDDDTRHGQEFDKNPNVAGSIVLETNIIGKIRGIQFSGKAERPDKELHKKAKRAYLLSFPVAALMNTSLWLVRVDYFKLTDNRLGFGKKLHWKREEERGQL